MDQKQYYEIIVLAWNYFKRWAALLPLNEEQWLQAVKEGGNISNSFPEKYRHFAADEMVTKINELERMDKEMRDNDRN